MWFESSGDEERVQEFYSDVRTKRFYDVGLPFYRPSDFSGRCWLGECGEQRTLQGSASLGQRETLYVHASLIHEDLEGNRLHCMVSTPAALNALRVLGNAGGERSFEIGGAEQVQFVARVRAETFVFGGLQYKDWIAAGCRLESDGIDLWLALRGWSTKDLNLEPVTDLEVYASGWRSELDRVRAQYGLQ